MNCEQPFQNSWEIYFCWHRWQNSMKNLQFTCFIWQFKWNMFLLNSKFCSIRGKEFDWSILVTRNYLCSHKLVTYPCWCQWITSNQKTGSGEYKRPREIWSSPVSQTVFRINFISRNNSCLLPACAIITTICFHWEKPDLAIATFLNH